MLGRRLPCKPLRAAVKPWNPRWSRRYFGVRRFAINKETGTVERSAAEFVLWTFRAVALLIMLFGSSSDHQVLPST